MIRLLIFAVLAMVILASAVAAVCTTRIMRAATFLLFTLFGIAGIYFLLDYTFLGTVQLAIYAGGVTVLYVFAINVVNKNTLQGLLEQLDKRKIVAGGLASLVGLIMLVFVFLKAKFMSIPTETGVDIDAQTLGNIMMGSGKYQYILPFEFISVFLLACIIGGIVIARKEDKK
ncbi:MAG: NADH-quinone oxidoreductase subunit J [Prevotella sp.]|nr:NADH-quinone oxidoreductase subunit J [Candidatus Equicola stercoris]